MAEIPIDMTANVIEKLATQNAESQRGLGDIFLFIIEARKGKVHKSIRNNDGLVRSILSELRRNVETIKNHWIDA